MERTFNTIKTISAQKCKMVWFLEAGSMSNSFCDMINIISTVTKKYVLNEKKYIYLFITC